MPWQKIQAMREVLVGYARVKADGLRMIPGPIIIPEILYPGTPLATVVFPAIQYTEWARAWVEILGRAKLPITVAPFALGNGYIAAEARATDGDRRVLDDALRALPSMQQALIKVNDFIERVGPMAPDPKPFPWLKTVALTASVGAAGWYSYQTLQESRTMRFM